LTRRPTRNYQTDTYSKGKIGHAPYKHRRPFWLPASNYYILAAAAAIALFFIIWGILFDDGEDAPWIVSGIAASGVLASAVVLREIVLRRAQKRYLLTQRRLDENLKSISSHSDPNAAYNKLSLEKHAVIVKGIQQKSEATRVLGKVSEGHLEVFEMCNDYLSLNKQQMETVGVGSPRLAALRRGKEIVQNLHYFHLMSWAQNESRYLTQESKIRVKISDKLEVAQRALTILNSASEFYPNDRRLVESERALKEFITSIKVSHLIEQAERAVFKGNNKRALNHYQDALFFLARENNQNEQGQLITEKINAEVEKLRQISIKTIDKND
jgi:hypothetical protein